MTGDPGTQLHSRESEKRVLGANPTRLRRPSNSPPPRLLRLTGQQQPSLDPLLSSTATSDTRRLSPTALLLLAAF